MQAQLSESPFITLILRPARIQSMCDFVEHEVLYKGSRLPQGGQLFMREVATVLHSGQGRGVHVTRDGVGQQNEMPTCLVVPQGLTAAKRIGLSDIPLFTPGLDVRRNQHVQICAVLLRERFKLIKDG